MILVMQQPILVTQQPLLVMHHQGFGEARSTAVAHQTPILGDAGDARSQYPLPLHASCTGARAGEKRKVVDSCVTSITKACSQSDRSPRGLLRLPGYEACVTHSQEGAA